MNRMSKLVCLISGMILFIPTVTMAMDFDFGGSLYNHTAYEDVEFQDDPALDQLDALALWFELYSKNASGGTFSFAGQARYEFAEDRYYLFDLDYLRIKSRIPAALGENNILDVTAGRFYFNDPTAMLLNHNADGLALGLSNPAFNLELKGAYTGFILNPQSDFRLTTADLDDENNEDDNFFGPKRAFAMLTLNFNDIGRMQKFYIFGAGQFDLRTEDDIKLHTQYAGLSANFLFGQGLYSQIFLIGQFGQFIIPDEDTRQVLGALLGFEMKYMNENLLNSQIHFRLLAAPPDFATDLTGTVDFGVSGFIPISQPDLGITVSPTYSSLGMVELDYMFKPLKDSASDAASRIQPKIGYRGYFRTYTVTVDWIETDPDSDSLYLGSEVEAGIDWRIFSDVGLGLTGALFFPGDAAEESLGNLWSIQLDLSVSF